MFASIPVESSSSPASTTDDLFFFDVVSDRQHDEITKIFAATTVTHSNEIPINQKRRDEVSSNIGEEERIHNDNLDDLDEQDKHDTLDDGNVDYLLDDMILSKQQMDDLFASRRREIKGGTNPDPTPTLPST